MLPNEDQPMKLELTRTPPSGLGERTYTIVRAPDKGQLTGVILDDFVTGTATHWTGTQTMPCVPGCNFCELDMASDWHSYFFLYGRLSQKICLVEITRGPLTAIRAYEDEHGKARGAVITIKRRRPKQNSPVIAELSPSGISSSILPKCPDLKTTLLRIWSGGRWHKSEVQRGLPVVNDDQVIDHGLTSAGHAVSEIILNRAYRAKKNGKPKE